MEGFFSFCIDQVFGETCIICGAGLEAPEPVPVLPLPPGWPRDTAAFLGTDFRSDLLGLVTVNARVLCPDCWLTLEPARPLSRRRKERAGRAPAGEIDAAGGGAAGLMRGEIPFISPFFTNEPLLEIVRYLKFSGGRRAAAPLAWWLARALGRWLASGNADCARPLVTAVPLHQARLRKRGYNQAAILAALAARRLGLPFAEGVLVRTRNTKSQSRLPDSKRSENVRDAFATAGEADCAGRDIVIVDDLVTTGETAVSCVKALGEAHPRSIAILSVGRPRSFS